MNKKRIMKSVKALLLCGVIATSSIAFAGCEVEAEKEKNTSTYTQFDMECCGKALLYNYVPKKSCGEKRLSVTGCKYFKTDSKHGRYTLYTKGTGIGVWTVKDGSKNQYNRKDGSIKGNTITLVLSN